MKHTAAVNSAVDGPCATGITHNFTAEDEASNSEQVRERQLVKVRRGAVERQLRKERDNLLRVNRTSAEDGELAQAEQNQQGLVRKSAAEKITRICVEHEDLIRQKLLDPKLLRELRMYVPEDLRRFITAK